MTKLDLTGAAFARGRSVCRRRGVRRFAARANGAAKSPVSLNIVDVAGQSRFDQARHRRLRRRHPNLVAHIAFSQAPAPELPAKIKAQQAANRVDIDLVLTGTDALAAGIQEQLWTELLARPSGRSAQLAEIYLPAANRMQGLAQGQGICVTITPPVRCSNICPTRQKGADDRPTSFSAYTKENKNASSMRARPIQSGRTLLMGLPYIWAMRTPPTP